MRSRSGVMESFCGRSGRRERDDIETPGGDRTLEHRRKAARPTLAIQPSSRRDSRMGWSAAGWAWRPDDRITSDMPSRLIAEATLSRRGDSGMVAAVNVMERATAGLAGPWGCHGRSGPPAPIVKLSVRDEMDSDNLDGAVTVAASYRTRPRERLYASKG
jgi:hypothetical protein